MKASTDSITNTSRVLQCIVAQPMKFWLSLVGVAFIITFSFSIEKIYSLSFTIGEGVNDVTSEEEIIGMNIPRATNKQKSSVDFRGNDLFSSVSRVLQKEQDDKKDASNFMFESLLHSVPTNLKRSDLVIFVLTRRNAFEVRKAIRETWASNVDIGVYFVVGKACKIAPEYLIADGLSCNYKQVALPSNHINITRRHLLRVKEEDEKLKREQADYHDLIITNFVDSYRLLPQKIKAMYEFMVQYLPETEWALKADDDFYVRPLELAEALRARNLNSSEPIVIGEIAVNWGKQTSGKWEELPQFGDKFYPKFPLGSVGHIVSKPVAEYIVSHQELLFNYQGEDVSLGIWLKQSPLAVKFLHQAVRMKNHGKCSSMKEDGIFVLGHDINPVKMKSCHAILSQG